MDDISTQLVADPAGSAQTDANAPQEQSGENTNLLAELASPEPSKDGKAAETPARIVERQKQVKAWVAKGQEGLKTLPADKEWLRPFIEAEFQIAEETPNIEKRVQEIYERKEAQLKVDSRYRALKETLLSMNPDDTKLQKVQERQDRFIKGGASIDEALSMAMEATGFPTDPEEQERLSLRKRMSLPAQGGKIDDRTTSPYDNDFHKKVIDPKEKMKILMTTLRGSR